MKNYILFLFIGLAFQSQAQTLTVYDQGDGLLNNGIQSVSTSPSNVAYFGTIGGIAVFDGANWTSYQEADGLVDDNVFAILYDSQGNIWAGTDFGISKFDGTNWTTYTTDDGLADNRIKHIFEAADGRLWFANNDGASAFDGTDFTNYTMDNGLPFGGVKHVAQDNNSDIWFATGLGGAFLLQNETLTGFDTDDGLLSNSVRSIAVDADNNKWIATSNGISVFDTDNIHTVNHEDIIELPEPHEINPVVDVKIDQFGRVWAGIFVDYLVTEGGIALYQSGEWTEFDVDDGLSGPVVRQLAIDSNSDVWVGTSGGATKVTNIPLSVEATANQTSNRMTLAPNPANEKVLVTDIDGGKTIMVCGLDGKVLQSQALASNAEKVLLDISALPSGVYLVKTENGVVRLVK